MTVERIGHELRKEVFETLARITTAQIEEQEENRQQAQSEANSHVGAMESRYDTFKEDAQYLSAGFERRIRELTAQRTAFTRWAQEVRLEPGLTPGALVRLRAENGTQEQIVIASSALDAKRTTNGGIRVQGELWYVRGEESGMGIALMEKENANREERRQLEDEVRRCRTERELAAVFAQMRGIVGEVEELRNVKATPKQVQRGKKILKGLDLVRKSSPRETKLGIKEDGEGLWTWLKDLAAMEEMTSEGTGTVWEDVKGEIEGAARGAPEHCAAKIQRWMDKIEQKVQAGGVEPRRARWRKAKSVTREHAVKAAMKGLREALNARARTSRGGQAERARAKAFRKAEGEMEEAMKKVAELQKVVETNVEAYWKVVEQIIEPWMQRTRGLSAEGDITQATAQRLAQAEQRLERHRGGGRPGVGAEIVSSDGTVWTVTAVG